MVISSHTSMTAFKFFILKFNILTPGRGEKIAETNKVTTNTSLKEDFCCFKGATLCILY